MQFLKNVTNQNEIIFSSSSKAKGQCFFKKNAPQFKEI
jgi:hypothetical protein